jgi:hypothetical protein
VRTPTPWERRIRASSRAELAEGEGLGQIIVAAGLEAADPVVHGGERAQDEDGCLVAGLAQGIDDGEAIDAARQHAIEDHHVVLSGGGHEQPVAAVIRVIDV